MKPFIEGLIKTVLNWFQTKNKKWFFIVLGIITLVKAAMDYFVPDYLNLGELTPQIVDWVTYVWVAITTVEVASSKKEEQVAEQKKLYPS